MAVKWIRLLTGRLTVSGILICLQAAVIAAAVIVLSVRWNWLLLAFFFISIGAALNIALRDLHPAYKAAWLMLILLFPLFGGLFYLALGHKGISRVLRHRHAKRTAEAQWLLSAPQGTSRDLYQFHRQAAVQSDYITRTGGFPPFQNTRVEYCPLGEEQFRLMMRELPKAKRFILLEYFILEEGVMWNTILALLRQKVLEGVEVLVLFDDLGCIQTLPQDYHRQLEDWGIRCAVFNPLRPSLTAAVNYRDHRKICVIDGQKGFCGGINLADEYINAYRKHGHWKDTAVFLEGEAVQSLTRIFLQNWLLSSSDPPKSLSRFLVTPLPCPARGWVQPYADSPLDGHNIAESVYLQMISRAVRYVYITSPYLILDHEMVGALQTAAESGVDVRIITPGIADKRAVHLVTRSSYPALIRSGVKIYEYMPGFIHAKMFVSDDYMAVVGTANLDYRSLYLHYECAVALFHSPVVDQVREDILDTIGQCRLITQAELDAQPRGQRLLSAFLRLFAPLM